MTKQQQTALQRGRERAAKRKRKESIARVMAYRKWLSDDGGYSVRRRALLNIGCNDMEIRNRLGGRPRMPAIPSDHDFQVAREAGKIT